MLLAEFISAVLSRHGKGANACIYFGNLVEINTKEAGTPFAVKVVVDYSRWIQEDQAGGACDYKGRFPTVCSAFQCTPAHAGTSAEFQDGRQYTEHWLS